MMGEREDMIGKYWNKRTEAFTERRGKQSWVIDRGGQIQAVEMRYNCRDV